MDTEGWDRPPLAEALAGEQLRVPLEEAALILARQEYPDLDPRRWLDEIDAWAAGGRAHLSAQPDAPEIVGVASDILFRDGKFRGNTTDYYDPRNSYLNEVIDRRTGIPITLSILYMAVARRLGLTLHGTAFPGHFLIVHPRPGWPVVLDAFAQGRILAEEECRQLAEHQGLRWDRRVLDPVPERHILRRVLNNLKAIYAGKQDWARLLRTSAQIAAVMPEESTECFTQGVAWAGLGERDAAIQSFEAYLAARPNAQNRDDVLDMLSQLRLKS